MVSLAANFSNVISDDHEFEVPKKAVINIGDMQMWQKSEAYYEYLGFLTAMNEEIKGKPNSGKYPKSAGVEAVLALLETFSRWIDEIPPLQQPQRFGNKAFRKWYERLSKESDELLKGTFHKQFHLAFKEIQMYLVEGFGNATRIDYGTGHEMSFCMFLCALFKIGAIIEEDKLAVTCYIFPSYLKVVRKLQKTYNMEPAGSRGVWALDDFQFIPFIWGSAQLIGHMHVQPSHFTEDEYVMRYADDYMFLSCIKFIKEVKVGPFAEHSNQLWNISGVANWSKVNSGLMKMYKAEVLGKFPVIQHVLFGSLFTIKEAAAPKPQTVGHNIALVASGSISGKSART